MKYQEIFERLEAIEEAIADQGYELDDAKTAAEQVLAQINERIEKLAGIEKMVTDLGQELPEDDDEEEEAEAA